MKGGFVIFGRVGGTLAVSRSFGDRLFKVPFSKTSADLVSVEPYTRTVQLRDAVEYLIVACDGLWDTLTYQEAIDLFVRQHKAGKSPQEIAIALVDAALKAGSLDNVTCIAVLLKK